MTTNDLQSLGLAASERDLLARYGFDPVTFARLRARLAAGQFSANANQVQEPVSPLLPGDLMPLPEAASPQGRADLEAGREAIRRGEVAVVILNGGMATRFGGVVKGVVEVTDGLSFLGLRLRDVANAPGSVTAFLMNSFATDADTRAHLSEHQLFGLPPERAHIVTQSISIRLTPSGDIFRDAKGHASLYAPGHGDLFHAVARSPEFQRFVAAGGKYVWVSNVDNVGATVSPRILGAHLRAGRRLSVEVAERAAGDKGGAPARYRGHIEVLEGFRFPPTFDIETIPVFNTNTMIIDAQAIRPDYDLTWFRADKKVEGQPVVQFERLMGEVTAFVDASYIVVPRDGAEGRFLPVKAPEDLEQLRPMIRERFGAELEHGIKS